MWKNWPSSVPIAAFILVVIGLSVRAALLMNVPGEPDFDRWAMQDFRDGTYYPTVSFLSGGNPYDAAAFIDAYPVRQTFSPYSPLYLLVHAPFGLLPHGFSQWLFFAWTIGLTVALAQLVLRLCARRTSVPAVLGLAALILASRPGHWNLLLGQPTLEFVFAAYVALYVGASAPWVAGAALAAATMKPTFGVPLAVLMLAQRSYRGVFIGLGIAAIVTLVPTAVLIDAAGGIVPFIESAWHSYAEFGQTVADSPVLCPTRIDAAAIVGRVWGEPMVPAVEIGIFALLIGLAAGTVRRVSSITSDWRGGLFCIAVATLAILVTTYHQGYCAVLLALPLTALVLNCWVPPELSATAIVRYVLIVLLSIPAVNYVASFSGSAALLPGGTAWRLVTVTNSAALLGALCVYAALAFRTPVPARDNIAEDSAETLR